MLHLPTTQAPLAQAGVPLLIALQVLAQPPQLAGSIWVSASQPVSGLPSQSPNQPLHEPAVHRPPTQITLVALASGPHALPQAPQFLVSLAVEVSQPLLGLVSQSL